MLAKDKILYYAKNLVFCHNSAKNDRIATKIGIWIFCTKPKLSCFINFLPYVVLKLPFWRFLKKGSMKIFIFFAKWKLHICSLWWYVAWFVHIFFSLNPFPDRRVFSGIYFFALIGFDKNFTQTEWNRNRNRKPDNIKAKKSKITSQLYNSFFAISPFIGNPTCMRSPRAAHKGLAT